MSDTAENYQDILQEHFYLFSRFLVAEDFLEQLISDEVLTLDDKEVISNRVVHQNRRQRANKLIEILMTRGEHGYQKFIEILEFQYPHVYETVTCKKPRDPPSGFHRNRFSDRLRMVHDLPNLLEHMKAQVEANTELDSQLSVLQQLLQVSKDENLALEKEIEMLKEVRQENMDLKIRLKTMELKDHESQVAISEWSQKSYQLLESVNEFKEKCHNLQVKYDDILKQKLSSNDVADNTTEAPEPTPPHQVTVTPAMSLCSVDNTPHFKARLEILQHELENQKQQCEDLTYRLQRANDSYQNLEENHEKLNKEWKRMAKEKTSLETQYMDCNVKKESYYKTIQKKNEEILELQHKRVEEQRHVADLNHEKNKLFDKNHQLEEQIQALKADNDKIRARLSTGSHSSQDYTGSSFDQSNGSSASDGDHVEDAPKVNRKIQRRKVVKKSASGDKYTNSEKLTALDKVYSQYQQNICDSIADGEDVSFKAYTLPSLASDTPERMFRREVAHFRYSRRNTETDSIFVHHGSQIEKNLDGEYVGMRRSDRISNFSLDTFSSTKKVPVSHPPDSNDGDDNDSDKTVFIARSARSSTSTNRLSRQEATQDDAGGPGQGSEEDQADASMKRSEFSATQIRSKDKGKSGGLPTGGKRYRKKDSESSQDLEGSAQCDSIIDRSDFSEGSTLEASDFSSHDVQTALLPRDPLVELCVNRPNWTDKNMSRFVKVKYSMLKDVEFVGGNHTGIFVSRASKQVELNEGEKIQGVSITPQERMNPIRTSLKGCTLQDFLIIIKGDMINKKKEREIILEVKNCRQEYMFACEWMKNNNGHGDFFFVRCNVDVDRKHDIGVSLRPGEVFLVKNSCYDGDQWLCHSVDPKSGIWSMTSSLIPNKLQANVRRLSSGRSVNESEKLQRRGFKVKGSVYDRVLPMKASVKLPIVVIGPDSKIVSAFLKLIQYETSDTFYVETDYSDNGDSREFCDDTELLRHRVHYVKPGRVESLKSRSVQKINIFLNVTSELSSLSVMKLFGDFFEGSVSKDVVTQSMIMKQKLWECRHKFEEICLPLVNNRDNLIEKFKKCVTEAQERLLWLSYSEIDEQIAARYPSYLGQYCDLNKLFQRSQSVG